MISSSYFWGTIVLLSAGTLAIRFSIIAISGRIRITDRHRELFSFIPAAIVPAIVVPMVFFHKGGVTWLSGKERLFALVIATLVCVYTRNMIMTLLVGLISLYVITHV